MAERAGGQDSFQLEERQKFRLKFCERFLQKDTRPRNSTNQNRMPPTLIGKTLEQASRTSSYS